MGISAHYKRSLVKHTHVFTHLEWHMQGYLFEAETEPDGFVFADADGLERLAMPAAIRPYREEAARILGGQMNDGA